MLNNTGIEIPNISSKASLGPKPIENKFSTDKTFTRIAPEKPIQGPQYQAINKAGIKDKAPASPPTIEKKILINICVRIVTTETSTIF